ncbi:MAG: DUF116 domain-containing protein [Thermoanaerobacteraceae bacterium]|nr:DUF116 domain-containing protein [Thermoanaerobacteraceae bacterium]
MYSRKRIFIAMMTATVLLLGTVVFGGLFLYFNRANMVNKIVLIGIGGLVLISLAVVGFGLLVMVITLWTHKTFPSLQNFVMTATNILFPIALQIGKVFGIDQDTIKSSFIAVNNQLVDNRNIRVKPHQLLILAPHCLQNSKCPYKITIDVENCRRCGGCPIHDLHRIKDKYGVNFVVATGGTLARRFVKEYKPRAIVAIACERDLTSGVQDVNPLPVIGVLNIRPEGPCFNTQVNLNQVEAAVRQFIGEGERRTAYSSAKHITEV